MRAIITDLHARLTAALSVPVLLPEQREEPLRAAPVDAQGRPVVGGGERGLGAYLAAHPGGYVQLEEAQGVYTQGAAEVYWIPVACIAPTPEAADALARAALLTTCGVPTRSPGRYTLMTPQSSTRLADGAYLARPTIQAVVIGGQFP